MQIIYSFFKRVLTSHNLVFQYILIPFFLLYNRTCFHIFGLLSATTKGVEILDQFNWEVVPDVGVALPVNSKSFLNVFDLIRF